MGERRLVQLVNLAQLLLAPLPAYLAAVYIYDSGGKIDLPFVSISVSSSSSSPFVVANLLLAGSLFLGWLASLAQRSTWLIDPYWTLVPPLLDAFFRKACDGDRGGGKGDGFFSSSLFPWAKNSKNGDVGVGVGVGVGSNDLRARAATALLLLWSLRLTHSYFRRERWQLGRREDWRYAEMRREWGKSWWWWSVVPVYAVQHFLLVGLALPCYALRCRCSCRRGSSPSSSCSSSSFSFASWHPLWDSLAVAGALSGLALAFSADSQLHAFVSSREEERRRGRPAEVLDAGVWGLCRHPNYLGETVFHCSLAALAVGGMLFGCCGGGGGGGRGGALSALLSVLWPLSGAVLNTTCLVFVTRMTEERTSRARGRERAWREYCARVPCWLPRLGLAKETTTRSKTK